MRRQAAFDKPVRPAALGRGENSRKNELNGVEEGRDEVSDEEGDRIDGEEELAAPDWRVRAGPRNKPTEGGERRVPSNTRTVQRLVCTLHDGMRPHPSPRGKTKQRGSVEKAHHCHGLLLH